MAQAKGTHSMILDFHFQDCEGKSLNSFACKVNVASRPALISFHANGATCAGMKIARAMKDHLTASQQQVLELFDKLLNPESRNSFRSRCSSMKSARQGRMM